MSGHRCACSELVVALCGRGLKKKDLTSNSDPFAVVSVRDEDGVFQEVGRTEVVEDTQDPDWTTALELVYFFEEEQMVRVEVFDQDKRQAQTLGLAEFTLGRLAGASSMCLEMSLRTQGSIVLRAEEKVSASEHVRVQLKGHKLKNKDGLFGRSDPFFEISRVNEDSSYTMVFLGPVVENDLSPVWPEVVLSAQRLANGDLLRPLRVEIRDYDSDGDHASMGIFQTSLQELTEAGRSWDVRIDGKKKGKVEIMGSPELFRIPTFLDYLKGGLQINVTVAIDFTGSNGDPSQPGSLHHVADDAMNDYQKAIASCLSILAEYDHDKMFNVYGFGAKGFGSVGSKHIFPLDGENPKHGVDGVMDAYRNGLQALTLSGPTLLNPILRSATRGALRIKEARRKVYSVLLILCDGSAEDFEACVNTLVEAAAEAPLSVVLVGVGDADFSALRRFDGDEHGLRNEAGQRCSRDIVQFVPMREFSSYNAGARLAREVLAEIPSQVLAYHFGNRIPPGAPEPPTPGSLAAEIAEMSVSSASSSPPGYDASIAFDLHGLRPSGHRS